MKFLIIIFGLINFAFAQSTAESFVDNSSIPRWAKSPISRLVDYGVLSGNPDGTFAPNRGINRAEFSKLLVNSLGNEIENFVPLKGSFPDVKPDDWFFPYVETAKHYGWIEGDPDGVFRPGDKINRAEAAKMLVNAFGFEVGQNIDGDTWYAPYFRVLRENDLLAYNSLFENPGYDKEPSRAEISEQIVRFLERTGKELIAIPLPTNKSRVVATPKNPAQEYVPEPSPFEYKETATGSLTIDPNAGTLYVEKHTSLAKKILVASNQSDVIAHTLKLLTKDGLSEVAGLQFRLVGNGGYYDYANVWLEINGKAVSEKIKPYDNVVNIPLNSTHLTIGSSLKTIMLKVDMSPNAKKGNNTRWVLFLPEWIDANTNKKIGFFPIGGSDIEIK